MTQKERSRKWYLANRELAIARSKIWNDNNPGANNRASRRWRQLHPDRAKAAGKKWREANPEKKKAMNKAWVSSNPYRGHVAFRKWLYGLTDDEFRLKIASQDNRCEICQEMFIKTPQVDHDHATNQNRGLLCRFCNLLLGNAHDNISVLEKAVQYLKKYGELNGRRTEA